MSIIFLPAVGVCGAGLVSVLNGNAFPLPRRPHEYTEHTVGAQHLLSLLNDSLFSTCYVTTSGTFIFLSSGVPPFTSFLKPLLTLASHCIYLAVTAPNGPLSPLLCTWLLETYCKKEKCFSPLPSENR